MWYLSSSMFIPIIPFIFVQIFFQLWFNETMKVFNTNKQSVYWRYCNIIKSIKRTFYLITYQFSWGFLPFLFFFYLWNKKKIHHQFWHIMIQFVSLRKTFLYSWPISIYRTSRLIWFWDEIEFSSQLSIVNFTHCQFRCQNDSQ